jgi:HYR domain
VKRVSAIAAAATLLLATAVTSPVGASPQAVGTLDLAARLLLASDLGECPAAAANTCASRRQAGSFPGLGQVASSYTWLADVGSPSCATGFGKALAHTLRLVVASKGEIEVAFAPGAQCIDQEAVRSQTQSFTITGGTGAYAGASGAGTITQVLESQTATGRAGTATWAGTLSVPGLDFDVTPPVLTGAANKTVKAKKGAKRARVTFRVTAQDDRDGSVPVKCFPQSGFRFSLGRTRVTCSAVDTSANAASAAFTVTVKKTR